MSASSPVTTKRATRRQQRRRRLLTLLLLGLASFGAILAVLLHILLPPEEEFFAATHAVTTGTKAPVVSTMVLSPEAAQEDLDIPMGDLCLVNAQHLWDQPESETLVRVYDEKSSCYNVRDTTVLLEDRVMAPLNAMLVDFVAATGCDTLLLCAGYRTVQDQQDLWDQSMERYGAEHTYSYFAQPGASEHHTGLALDFSLYDVSTGETYDFDGTGDAQWLLEHSWEYGFVQRYPEGKADITGISTEPWHFRYVGQPHAYLMENLGMCLEEYLTYLQGFPVQGDHLLTEYDGTQYEIWYCTDTDPVLPDSGEYALSGDNCGGVIVTRKLE